MTQQPSRTIRVVGAVLLVLALVALGTGVGFWLAGQEVMILTLFFLGIGTFLAIKSLGMLLTGKLY